MASSQCRSGRIQTAQSEIESIRFKWTINNFSSHVKQYGYSLKSSTFAYEIGEKTEWRIEAFPDGNTKNCKGNLSLFLGLASERQERTVTFRLSIINNKDEKTYEHESLAHIFTRDALDWGWGQFINLSILRDKKKGLLPNDSLTIWCEINPPTTSTSRSGSASNIKIPECRLGEDFSDLFIRESFSDVTLMAQGEAFRVHKNILAARSSVFNTMFTTEMKEKNQDVINIVDMDKDVLSNMLAFMYSGKAPADTSFTLTCDLLAAAEKYDLKRLKLICEKVLSSQPSIDNASDLLIISYLHNADQLKATVMKFVITNIAAVKKSENWTMLIRNYPFLLNEVYDYHLQHGLGDIESD